MRWSCGPGCRAAYLFDGDQDDVAGHNLDDVDLQEPPDEELQLVEVLQELEEQHREPVHHQVPFVLQVWSSGSREHTLRFTHTKKTQERRHMQRHNLGMDWAKRKKKKKEKNTFRNRHTDSISV